MRDRYVKFLIAVCLFPFILPLRGITQPPYTVSGIVYVDHDNNAVFDGLDYGHPAITVHVFEDANGNEQLDPGETLLGTAVTTSFGNFSITGINPGGPEFTIGINPDDLAPGFTISNGPFTRPVGNYLNEALSFQGENVVCYTVSDETFPDILAVFNRISGTHARIGSWPWLGNGVFNVEAISFDIGAKNLYAIDGGQLGTIDIHTGVFTPSPNPLGTVNHSTLGSVLVDDADGMCFDPFTGELYATVRLENPPAPDLLIKVDVATGMAISNAFGPGNDYVPLLGATPGYSLDVDDIGIHPLTGIMYAINNSNGINDVLVEVDKATGIMTEVGLITYAGPNGINPLNDVEGFGFTNSGILVATTGEAGSTSPINLRNAAFTIDLATLQATRIVNFNDDFNSPDYIGSDFEGCDCLTQRENVLSGTVFFDEDKNGIQDPSELGAPNVTVYIYIDVNGDGLVDAGDILVDFVVTDADGNYSWITASDLNFVITLDPSTFPPLFSYTANTTEEAPFGSGFGGQTNPNNNFGIATVAFPIELVDLTVVQNGLGAKLQWTTASEINSHYFSVERSLDGQGFAAPHVMGRVAAAGFSSQEMNYAFYDPYVALEGASRIYYRLRTVDIDGTYDYSYIVELQLAPSTGLQTRVSPNPLRGDFFRVDYVAERAGIIEYRLMAASGQVIERKRLPDLTEKSGSFEISTLGLPAGLYLLHISNGPRSETCRINITGR